MFNLLNFLTKVFLKTFVISKSIFLNSKNIFNIKKKIFLIYVLPIESKIDLFLLKEKCEKHKLPNPLDILVINKKKIKRCLFLFKKDKYFPYFKINTESIKLIENIFNFIKNKPDLDIYFILVYIIFGRFPGKEKKAFLLNKVYIRKKIFSIFFWGRDSFVFFSELISLHFIYKKYGYNINITKKLFQIAYIYFKRQYFSSVGPNLITRKKFFFHFFNLKTIQKTIKNETNIKKISSQKIKKNVINITKEIFAHFSYFMIRITNYFMKKFLKRLYYKIYVYGKKNLQKIVNNQNTILYLPCHRSHMDYLLLSYILYHEGLVIPHIAAGINLNFWPVGFILRRLGAFFIRRTFQRNKLYSVIVHQYLIYLFQKGYPVEYFLEGKRSRTGYLLNPKTGMLSMTVQSIFKMKPLRPIVIVPIYIGYENLIESDVYIKELYGEKKRKERFLQIITEFKKLKNFGNSFLNFGKPFFLIDYLNKYIPNWKKYNDSNLRPSWLIPTVNNIAKKIMIQINNLCVVNPVNLCTTILLSTQKNFLKSKDLINQLDFYLKLLRQIPYSSESIISNMNSIHIFKYVESMKKIFIYKDSNKDIIIFSKNSLIMNYYRNNIHHMLIIPELIAAILYKYNFISWKKLLLKVKIIYPFLKDELFLHWKVKDLPNLVRNIINEFIQQEILFIKNDNFQINNKKIQKLKLLYYGIYAHIYKYTIIFSILYFSSKFNKTALKRKIFYIIKYISIRDPYLIEYFNNFTFSSFISVLRYEKYFDNYEIIKLKKVKTIYFFLKKLINKKNFLQIQNSILSFKDY